MFASSGPTRETRKSHAPQASDIDIGMRPTAPSSPVEWRIADAPVGYAEAVAAMEDQVAAIRNDGARERVWLVEHPPLYTGGTSARPEDLLAPDRFPVFQTGRGGQYTYHGPGQRIAYVMLDLNRREPDLRRYVRTLEEWVIRTLAAFNVRGERRADRIGVWVARPDKGIGRRGQDRGDRHSHPALGDLPRHRPQRRPGAGAFRRHRALRHPGPWRHQPGRSRHPGDDAGGRRGDAARIRGAVRRDDGLDRRPGVESVWQDFVPGRLFRLRKPAPPAGRRGRG